MHFGPPEPLQSQMMLLGCGSSGAGTAWTPLALSPLIWADATQLGLSDGAAVAQFTDLSGNGNHFVQATTANKPTFRTSGINGLASIETDGVDDAMTLAAIGAQTDWWAFLVTRLITGPGYGVLWGIDDFGPDADYTLVEVNGITALRMAKSGATSTSLTVATATNYTFVITGTGSAGNIYTASLGTSTSASSFSRANGGMRLGNRGDSQPINAQFGELAFGSGTLTSDQRAQLFAYANTKWGTAAP